MLRLAYSSTGDPADSANQRLAASSWVEGKPARTRWGKMRVSRPSRSRRLSTASLPNTWENRACCMVVIRRGLLPVLWMERSVFLAYLLQAGERVSR